MRATQVLKSSVDDSSVPLDTDRLNGLIDSVMTAAREIDVVSQEALPTEQLLYLKGLSLELQLLAAEYENQSTAESADIPEVKV